MCLIPHPRRALDELPCLSRCCRDHREDEPGVRLCETAPVVVSVGTDEIGTAAELVVSADRCVVDDVERVLWSNPARITLDGPDGSMTLTPASARDLWVALGDLLGVVEASGGPA